VKKFSLPATALILSLLSFNAGSQVQKAPKVAVYNVIEVQDGDSFVIDKSQKVRLLSVDAPKIDLCNGEESKKHLEKLIKGKKVTLHEIVADKFRRIVALVYVDDVLINAQMARAGMVKYNSIFSSDKQEIVEAEDYAQENKLGIYSEKCLQIDKNLDNPKCNIKGNISRDDGGIYSFPGCSSYNNIKIEKFLGDEWFCSEKEAKASNFRKSKNCYDLKYQKPK
jgi:micrococcal nuclease